MLPVDAAATSTPERLQSATSVGEGAAASSAAPTRKRLGPAARYDEQFEATLRDQRGTTRRRGAEEDRAESEAGEEGVEGEEGKVGEDGEEEEEGEAEGEDESEEEEEEGEESSELCQESEEGEEGEVDWEAEVQTKHDMLLGMLKESGDGLHDDDEKVRADGCPALIAFQIWRTHR